MRATSSLASSCWFWSCTLGILLVRNRPQEMGLEPLRPTQQEAARRTDPSEVLLGRDATFTEALQTGLFWRLTFGYFV